MQAGGHLEALHPCGCLLGPALGITDKMEERPQPPHPPTPPFHRHRPGMKELGLVILTCFFLSSAELTEKEY